MKVSRRDFVATSTCAAAASLCAFPSSAFAGKNNSGSSIQHSGVLLDLASNCALPESFAGMQSALANSHRRITANDLVSTTLNNVVVIPAAAPIEPDTYRAIAESLESGTRVVWESGAAFVSPDAFSVQQALAKKYFGISMAQPIDVWSHEKRRTSESSAAMQTARNRSAIGHEQIPYITYRWPNQLHVRDFSRVVPVSAANGRAIAYWGKEPVALETNLGAGSLIFLGSPVGPALLAGDPEAQALFQSILAR